MRQAVFGVLTFVVLVVAPIAAFGVLLWATDFFGHEELRNRLRIGMTEAQVRDAMQREPTHVYHRDTAPRDYYVDGWSCRERAITGKVWIFVCGEPICYVWFDRSGVVEDIFVGGS